MAQKLNGDLVVSEAKTIFESAESPLKPAVVNEANAYDSPVPLAKIRAEGDFGCENVSDIKPPPVERGDERDFGFTTHSIETDTTTFSQVHVSEQDLKGLLRTQQIEEAKNPIFSSESKALTDSTNVRTSAVDDDTSAGASVADDDGCGEGQGKKKRKRKNKKKKKNADGITDMSVEVNNEKGNLSFTPLNEKIDDTFFDN